MEGFNEKRAALSSPFLNWNMEYGKREMEIGNVPTTLPCDHAELINNRQKLEYGIMDDSEMQV